MSSSGVIAKNTALQLCSKLTTSLFGLLSRKLLTNYLGPAGFGDYIFALTYANLFSALADWGTLIIGIREASKRPFEQPSVFGSVFLVRLFLALIATLIAAIILPLLHLSSALLLVVLFTSSLIFLFAIKASFGLIFDTLLRQDRWYLVELATAISSLSLFSLAIYFQAPLLWFSLALITSTVIAIVLSYVLSRPLSRLDLKFRPGLLKYLALESLPTGGILILFNIYNRIDTVLLKYYSTSTVVGLYGLAYFIYENITVVASFIMKSALPILSPEVTSTGPSQLFKKYYQKIFDLMLTLSLLSAFAAFTLSPVLVLLISSSSFTGSIFLLRILSFSVVFAFLNHLSGYSLVALGKQKPYMLISFVAMIFNVVANLILIPIYGAQAAAFTTIATEALVQVFSYLLISKSLGFSPSFTSFPQTMIEFIRTRGQIF